jgi:hypothetical protein
MNAVRLAEKARTDRSSTDCGATGITDIRLDRPPTRADSITLAEIRKPPIGEQIHFIQEANRRRGYWSKLGPASAVR